MAGSQLELRHVPFLHECSDLSLQFCAADRLGSGMSQDLILLFDGALDENKQNFISTAAFIHILSSRVSLLLCNMFATINTFALLKAAKTTALRPDVEGHPSPAGVHQQYTGVRDSRHHVYDTVQRIGRKHWDISTQSELVLLKGYKQHLYGRFGDAPDASLTIYM